jgi:hypothetical protein
MASALAGLTFKRTSLDGRTTWAVVHEGSVIGHVTRTESLGRTYSKSNMGTRHVVVWRSSVSAVDGLADDERRAVEREVRRRDKLSREAAARYIVESYTSANVALPTSI